MAIKFYFIHGYAHDENEENPKPDSKDYEKSDDYVPVCDHCAKWRGFDSHSKDLIHSISQVDYELGGWDWEGAREVEKVCGFTLNSGCERPG